jgi:hypothetical protein
MDKNSFEERRRALEEAFFQKQDVKLLESMRQQEALAELAAASGLADNAALQALVAAGVNASTLAALSLVPLVFVAWADRSMDDRERQAILAAANDAGIAKGGAAHGLIEKWLHQRPPAALFDAWVRSVEATTETLDADAAARLRTEVVDRATTVAAAAGGFLGIGTVSAVEAETIAKIDQAFGG